MKTKNRNNRTKKSFLRGAAVIVSFVLISFTVSAQGFWKQLLINNSFGKMAMLMVEEPEAELMASASETPKSIQSNSESSNFYLEPASDKSLELEDWMTNDFYFGAFNHILDPAVENNLELEDWMKDESHFSNQFAVDQDKDLKLEAWMTENKYWRL